MPKISVSENTQAKLRFLAINQDLKEINFQFQETESNDTNHKCCITTHTHTQTNKSDLTNKTHKKSHRLIPQN